MRRPHRMCCQAWHLGVCINPTPSSMTADLLVVKGHRRIQHIAQVQLEGPRGVLQIKPAQCQGCGRCGRGAMQADAICGRPSGGREVLLKWYAHMLGIIWRHLKMMLLLLPSAVPALSAPSAAT